MFTTVGRSGPVTTDLGGDLCGRGCGLPTECIERETMEEEEEVEEEVAGIRAGRERVNTLPRPYLHKIDTSNRWVDAMMEDRRYLSP